MPKQISLHEAVRMIPNFSSVFMGGFGYTRECMSFSRELIRQKKHGMHLICAGAALYCDFLAGGGVADKIEGALTGIEPLNAGSNIRRRLDDRDLKIEDYSNLSMAMRLYGGALGVPFMPVKSVMSSDIELKSTFKKKGSKLSVVECPFSGEYVTLLPAINPDFGIIQVQRVDTEGNAQIDDTETTDVDGLKASDVKIVLAEEIVSPKTAGFNPKLTAVPGLMVDYIVHAPMGAWPTSMFNYYNMNRGHIDYYVRECKTEEGFKKYLKDWVLPDEETIFKKINANKKTDEKT
jgi:glutaconate CoA-transferase, subunit A